MIRRTIRLHEVGLELSDELLAANLRGPYLVLHAALPELLRADGDRCIVNVSPRRRRSSPRRESRPMPPVASL